MFSSDASTCPFRVLQIYMYIGKKDKRNRCSRELKSVNKDFKKEKKKKFIEKHAKSMKMKRFF